MARVLSNSILDCRLTGSIGDKVFYIVNGKQYMKAKAVKDAKVARSKTQAQLEQGARFKLVMQFLKPLRVFLREGFKSKAGSMSPFNAAFANCIRHSITGIYPDFQIDYPNLLVSKGPALMAQNPTVKSTLDGKIEVNWEDNSYEYGDGGDLVMILVYNPAKQQAVWVMKGNYRVSKSQVMELSNFKGDEVHCYIAFHNTRKSKVSDSRYVGSVMVE